MADPEPQMGGGGGNGHPDPEIRRGGNLKKNKNSAIRASVWSENEVGLGGTPGLSPESANYTLRMNAATSPGQWQPYIVVSPSVGSLRNDDGDSNENGKKSNRFRLAKQQLCACITFFLYIS